MFNFSLHSPIGFKEWSLVCEALGQGTQTIIFRKGGIAEGREGFAFQHPVFFLFPTLFHAQHEGICLYPDADWVDDTDPDQESVTLRYIAEITHSALLTDWDDVLALDDFHIWKLSVLKERFDYSDQGCLHLAVVRVGRLRSPLRFPYERRFHGCRSWIQLPEMATLPEIDPVLSDSEFSKLRDKIIKSVPKVSSYSAR